MNKLPIYHSSSRPLYISSKSGVFFSFILCCVYYYIFFCASLPVNIKWMNRTWRDLYAQFTKAIETLLTSLYIEVIRSASISSYKTVLNWCAQFVLLLTKRWWRRKERRQRRLQIHFEFVHVELCAENASFRAHRCDVETERKKELYIFDFIHSTLIILMIW